MTTVRKAAAGDIPRILELYRQLAFDPSNEVPNSPPEECRRVFDEIQLIPGYELLVAEYGGEVVGTTVLVILPGLTHGLLPFAVLEYVVVDEKCRRRGIGRALMDYCVARAKDAGCYKIMLTSDKRREPAHRFYESLGFEASAHGFRLYL
ncbi:MAG: GNAT family N-acetyltransferase [Chloroflexota bacterium]